MGEEQAMKKLENETQKEFEKRLDQTDYHKLVSIFNDIGLDFHVVWGPGCQGCHMMLSGTALAFDEDLRFENQESYSIKEDRLE